MGRGGDKAVAPASKKNFASTTEAKRVSHLSNKWQSLPTEELRKKAKQFGHDDSLDREGLLRELVSRTELMTT